MISKTREEPRASPKRSSQIHGPCFSSSCLCLPLSISSFRFLSMILSLEGSQIPSLPPPPQFLNCSPWRSHLSSHLLYMLYVLLLAFLIFYVFSLKILWFLFNFLCVAFDWFWKWEKDPLVGKKKKKKKCPLEKVVRSVLRILRNVYRAKRRRADDGDCWVGEVVEENWNQPSQG